MAPLLTFYGDDFTGSCSVMESLSFSGVRTMLFMDTPSTETLAQYSDLQAVGVAGVARSKKPEWMKANLPQVFEALKCIDAPLFHYKVCSTFDSSPKMGSIGAAIDIGAEVFEGEWIPLVVGDPAVRRYQVFGQLFAGAGEGIYRLDRHPVMSRHPVTPMDEADLAVHLSKQTELSIGVINFATMKTGNSDQAIAQCLSDGTAIVAIDVLDDETLAEAGRLIWSKKAGPAFAVGSQGLENALVAHWRATGFLAESYEAPAMKSVQQLFAVSGSCAPTTAEQIAYAEAKGFQILNFDAATAVHETKLASEVERICSETLSLLADGHDVLVSTTRGPDDPAIARMAQAVDDSSISISDANDRLGNALGQLVTRIRKLGKLQRIAIAGGDTSGHALAALGAEALSTVAPLTTGVPLCQVHCRAEPALDGLEVALKGGQMGAPSFFLDAKGQT